MIVPMYYLCVEGLKTGIRRNPNASCHPKEHLKSHIIRAEGVRDKECSWSSSGCAAGVGEGGRGDEVSTKFEPGRLSELHQLH